MTSSIIYEGRLHTRATHLASGSHIETDAPTDNQGRGENFSPTDLVATALASCMLTIMGIKAQTMPHVQLEGTRVDALKIMASDPRRISGIRLDFHFPEAYSRLPEKDRKILENAALACPVAKSIHPDIQMEVLFHY